LYSIKYGKPFILINNESTNQKVRLALENTGQDFRKFERPDLDATALDLLESTGGLLPEAPAEWIARSKGFLQEAVAFRSPQA